MAVPGPTTTNNDSDDNGANNNNNNNVTLLSGCSTAGCLHGLVVCYMAIVAIRIYVC